MASKTGRRGLLASPAAQRLGKAALGAGNVVSGSALFYIDITNTRGVLDSVG